MRDIAMAAVSCAALSGLSQGAEPCGSTFLCGSSARELFDDPTYSVQKAAMYDGSFVKVDKAEPAYASIGMISNDKNNEIGTAFLIAQCYVLTNYHALYNIDVPDDSIHFIFGVGKSADEDRFFKEYVYATPVALGDFSQANETCEDFAVLKLPEGQCLGDKYGYVELWDASLDDLQKLQQTKVKIKGAGYPRTETLSSISVDPSCEVSDAMHPYYPQAFAHTCSSMEGMSGGPLYSELHSKSTQTTQLVAYGILQGGFSGVSGTTGALIYDDTLLTGADAVSPTLRNRAVPISCIYDRIKEFVPE